MSFPFGGHPRFGQYVTWACETHGFEVRTGSAADESGRSHTVTRIFKAGSQQVALVGVELKDYLVPSLVTYLDRRLGVNSPWFSLASGDAAEEAGEPDPKS